MSTFCAGRGTAFAATLAAILLLTPTANASVHFVSSDIRSMHGQRVAAIFAQLLLLEDLEPLSDLVLVERDEPRRGQVLALESAVRVLHQESYRIMRVRDLESPESLARRFVNVALASRVIAPSSSRSR